MPPEHVETLIIGGGQAGLAMSRMLSQRGLQHLILERHRIAERWHSERWDGLRFQGPNWTARLPDFSFPDPDADTYATGRQIADFLTAYADFIAAPVRCGVEVATLRQQAGADGFIAETPGSRFTASNVVVATGAFQRPVVPDLLAGESGLFQVHSSRYRNPQQLPPGAVLVIGAGNSGSQIADELSRAGRRVFLSIGRHRRVPRHYRGRNLHWWMDVLGITTTSPEKRGADRSPIILTGAYGGYTVDFRQFAARGIVLLGRAERAEPGVVHFAADLAERLAHGDAAFRTFLAAADAYVAREGLEFPADPAAWTVTPDPPALTGPPIRRLDLADEGIGAVVWGTGYAMDFGWIDIPVLGAGGAPLHHRGITGIPGLYFLGLPYLSQFISSFIYGVGEDAARLADHIARRMAA